VKYFFQSLFLLLATNIELAVAEVYLIPVVMILLIMTTETVFSHL